jgi:hypothetical protein
MFTPAIHRTFIAFCIALLLGSAVLPMARLSLQFPVEIAECDFSLDEPTTSTVMLNFPRSGWEKENDSSPFDEEAMASPLFSAADNVTPPQYELAHTRAFLQTARHDVASLPLCEVAQYSRSGVALC